MKKHLMMALLGTALAAGLMTGCAAANATPGAGSTSTSETSVASAASVMSVAAKSEAASTASAEDVENMAPKETVAWPKGAVQLLVPSKAGGVTDIYTRYVQEALQKSTGGSFATVNYDNETVGYETLRSAKADGSSVLFQHSTVICKYLTGAIDYDPSQEFRVVGEVADMGSQAIIAGPDAPYSTWEEFAEYAKAHPGEITTAISTNGTTHFIWGQVEQTLGIELNKVECSSEADKLTNVSGGIIEVANCSLANAKQYEDAGNLKVLGVLGSGKEEAGYPEWKPITDVLWTSHLYAFVPASTDDATAEAVNQALKALTEDENYAAECETMGGKPEWYSLEEVEADFAETMKTLSEVASGLGINKRE